MASPAEPVTTEPTGALFRALRSVDVEPNLAYEAAGPGRTSSPPLEPRSTPKVSGSRLKSKPKPRASTFYSV